MKNFMATLAVMAVLATGVQTASAGDREWATAGKILTGVAVGAAIAAAVEPPHVYAYSGPAYYPPPPAVCVQAAPVVVYPAPICVRPGPVVVYGARPPVVSFRLGFAGGYHHHPRHWICR